MLGTELRVEPSGVRTRAWASSRRTELGWTSVYSLLLLELLPDRPDVYWLTSMPVFWRSEGSDRARRVSM